ncbi:putative glycoside hydrolase [Pengzhenrongella frigida]|uniref:Uncharacterized protein n=1 Tax=Pengzhenrongella frigida TaxID=1259133 RepID=A0A4Q5MXY9_9MICO|nr:putative glycoside hydrolase [Cellulomonas sp. HLT2-17]RYV49823.1 hypothetical protein EUA98_16820 [Cellulomonas sp. HLT2-17]
MSKRHGAWIRYGDALEPAQVAFAAEHYQVAILQPWETDALKALKTARPDMTVLAYKCLSSTRSFEPGPVYSSGVCFEEAEESGEEWFAHRADGVDRIEWNTYAGQWQMATWNADYRERWCDNVADELEGSLWDGIMADNDVFDDYYGIRPPIEGGRTMADLRGALDEFVPQVGARLNGIGKLLVPNIAESRRDPGRWARHAAFGGGFEEVWLAWGPDDYLDPYTVDAQGAEVSAPGLSILRIASDGTNEHRNFTYGLAALWVYGAGPGGAFTATSRDGYSATPYIPQLDWDLGEPVEDVVHRGNGRSRAFSGGWAAINLNSAPRRKVTFAVPAGLHDVGGRPAPSSVTLAPHEGVLFVS